MEQEIDVRAADGAMNTFVVHPDEGAPWGCVVVLMDAPGVRDSLRDIARRIATVGYLVALPNLYYRLGRDVTVGPTRDHPEAETNRARLAVLVRSLPRPGVATDVGHLLEHLGERFPVAPGRAAVVGYCMSGAFALLAAARDPARIACAASYYGTRLVGEGAESPHRRIAAYPGEVYLAFAEHDEYAPPDVVAAVSHALATGRARYRVEVYAGTHHGFAFVDRGTFDRPASERHFERLFALLRRHLDARP
ncbi:MAG: dienelactone hydrolase family protein [Candidatus Rokubacteria bacterium]|nr:dienelactone hydrolase family protein [Candidatus Rokubacteria bacterium]